MASNRSEQLATIELLLGSIPTDADPSLTIKREVVDGRTQLSPDKAKVARRFSDLEVAVSKLPTVSVGGEPGAILVPGGDGPDLEIQSTLGEGGMGVVYVARQRSLNREVALKVVRSGERRRELAALLHEARLMGSLEHPGIVPVHALGADATGRPILVMKRIEGTTWQTLLDEPEHDAWETIAPEKGDRLAANLDILEHVTTAIAFGHSRGVLHRDIKPANVLIGSFGEVYVADWGIALEMEKVEGQPLEGPIGTPAFMAPEMAVGDVASMDERTDVFLLGSTLHYVLTGKPRHRAPTTKDVIIAAAMCDPPVYDDSVPRALAELATRATSPEKDDRPATALEFREGLEEFVRHRASLALAERASTTLEKAGSAEPGDATRRSHLIEARYGFREALREWSNNSVARAGLARALEATLELEIAERALGAAKATLGEMESPTEAQKRSVAELEAELRREAEERDAARALERDLDPTVASRKRTIFLAVLCVFGVGITFAMRNSRMYGVQAPIPRTIVLPVILALALSPIAWWLRADLGKSAVNRRFLAIIYVVFGASTVLRAVAFIYQTHINQMMTFELLLIGTAAATLGVTFQRSFFWVAAGAVACAFGAQAFPAWLEAFYIPPFLGLIALSTFAKKKGARA